MSRHEEFKEIKGSIVKIFNDLQEADRPEVIRSAVEGGKLEMLTDIAESLAIIADNAESLTIIADNAESLTIIADNLKEINARQALKDI